MSDPALPADINAEIDRIATEARRVTDAGHAPGPWWCVSCDLVHGAEAPAVHRGMIRAGGDGRPVVEVTGLACGTFSRGSFLRALAAEAAHLQSATGGTR